VARVTQVGNFSKSIIIRKIREALNGITTEAIVSALARTRMSYST
jgi:hypothetical protein